MKREIRLEHLVGRRIRNVRGEVIGKIREVEAEWHGNRCVVTQLHLGGDVRVPIGDVDFSDPTAPCLRGITREMK